MSAKKKPLPSSEPAIVADDDFSDLFAAAQVLASKVTQRPPGAFTMTDYCTRQKVSKSVGQRHISALIKAGRVRKMGAGSNVFYVRATPAKD